MAWGLQQRDLPILTPGQMNPMNQAFQAALESYGNIERSKALPQQLQADIASKSAYAAYTPAGYASKIISNPEIFYTLPKEQQQQLLNTVANMPSNPMDILKQRSGNQGGPLSQLWNGAFGSNQQQGMQQQRMPQTPSQGKVYQDEQPVQQGNYPGSNTPIYEGDMGTGSAPPMNSDQAMQIVENRPDYNVPIDTSNPRMNQFNRNTGTSEGNRILAEKFPSNEFNELKEAKKLEQKMQSDLWAKRIEKTGEAIDQTQESLTALKAMESLYGKIDKYQKGPLFGNLPALGSGSAGTFDTLAKNVATSNLRAMQTGHITNVDFQIGDQLKPNRTMNKDQFKNIIEYQKGIKERTQERLQFDTAARKAGTPIDQANSIWAKYIADKPFFNSETNRINKDNMNKWQPYLKGNSVNYGEAKNEAEVSGRSPPEGTVWMIRPDKMKVPVHKDNVNQAMSQYKFQLVG